jgi:hypothetical protein
MKRFTVIGLYMEPRQTFAHGVNAVDEADAIRVVERDFLASCGDFIIVGVARGDVDIYFGLDEGGGRS